MLPLVIIKHRGKIYFKASGYEVHVRNGITLLLMGT